MFYNTLTPLTADVYQKHVLIVSFQTNVVVRVFDLLEASKFPNYIQNCSVFEIVYKLAHLKPFETPHLLATWTLNRKP